MYFQLFHIFFLSFQEIEMTHVKRIFNITIGDQFKRLKNELFKKSKFLKLNKKKRAFQL